MRPPAVPLVAHDPYFSVWSMTDRLNQDGTKHWTGKPNSLTALVRIDGKTWRVMGRDPQRTPALEQTRVEVLPTRTIYEFAGAGVKVTLTFFTPALPEDLDVLSRPLTYIEWNVSATDGGEHTAAVYFEAASDLVVDTPDQPVAWSRFQLDGQPVLRMGSREQPVLAKRGDDLRIDWGYLYLAAGGRAGVTEAALPRDQARGAFEEKGLLPDSDDFSEAPRRGPGIGLEIAIDLGKVTAQPAASYLMLAYDDVYSIEYFQRRERPWWRRKGAEAADLLRMARRDHDALLERARRFDEELMSDLRQAGGEEYARLGALAYRQTLAAHKLVADADGTAMYFPKENFSNGCIATVDVIYPSSPFTLLFNPLLLKAQLQPVLDYARMDRWPWPFAPHDLGTYPQANGQVYGGGERTEQNQMPVEESGNMLIMMAALARVEGSAAFAEKYWPQLTRWAEYLKEKGLDPENQLSTDDFAGHLAHNINVARGNRPPGIQFLHLERDVGRDALRRQIRSTQLRRQRHRKAPRVRRRNQLLGIRPRSIFKTRRKRILRIVQHPTRSRNRSLPILQPTLPDRASLALHDVLLTMMSLDCPPIVDGIAGPRPAPAIVDFLISDF